MNAKEQEREIVMKFLFLFLLTLSLYSSVVKTPSDVYSYAFMLKKKVEYLRKQNGIYKPFPTVAKQYNKYPRHVIQKSLEILSKINLYRISRNYGAIYIPPYPARDVTPSDVYDSVKRLDEEVTPFIKNDEFLNSIKIKKFTQKTPNDVYQLLWSISLAFDSLLGIHGYTPTDVYALSEKLVKTIKFIRTSQNDYSDVEKPKKVEGQHPNHALYTSYDLLKKISLVEKKLWIEPAEVPKKPHNVITPTDVYDFMQYNLAELNRIKYRLGLERYYKLEMPKDVKTPSDVVQNLKYAIKLMPSFDFKNELIQYPSKSLKKTPNDVYAVTEEIIKKLDRLKALRGISQRAKIPPYIYGLKPIHAYQKAIEAIEKSIKTKMQMGFYPSQVPTSPIRKITPSEVYELVLRLDGIVTLLLHKLGDTKVDNYIYKLDKKVYTDKVPSDVYNNLWKISNTFDVLLAKEYTPNETYLLASKIQNKVNLLLKKLKIKNSTKQVEVDDVKTPADVLVLTIELFNELKHIQKRLNVEIANVVIPKEKNITPNSVYNALRIVNATLNEILIQLKIDDENLVKNYHIPKDKTPTCVYANVLKTIKMVQLIFKDQSYEK